MLESIFPNASTINWFIPTWDLLVFVFFIAISFIYGLSLGKERISISLMCIYVSLAITSNIPYLEALTEKVNWQYFYVLNIFAFWGIIILLFIIILQSPLASQMLEPIGGWKGRRRLSDLMLFSFLQIGFLTSITLSFLPLELVASSLPVSKMIFYSPAAKFIWLIAPLVTLILIQKQTTREIERGIQRERERGY